MCKKKIWSVLISSPRQEILHDKRFMASQSLKGYKMKNMKVTTSPGLQLDFYISKRRFFWGINDPLVLSFKFAILLLIFWSWLNSLKILESPFYDFFPATWPLSKNCFRSLEVYKKLNWEIKKMESLKKNAVSDNEQTFHLVGGPKNFLGSS